MRRKGASTPVLKIIASFLTNRTMTVRVGSQWSEDLQVNGGCPQGSVLGVLLFNTTTDDLENDFLARECDRLRLPQLAATDSPPPNPVPLLNGGATSSPVLDAHEGPLDPNLSPISAGGFHRNDPTTAHRPTLPFIPAAQPALLDPPREEAVGTQVLVQKQVRIFKYVDDNIICEKMNLGTTPVDPATNTKTKCAVSSQNAFRSISFNAESIGMRVNSTKTNILCVSDALN